MGGLVVLSGRGLFSGLRDGCETLTFLKFSDGMLVAVSPGAAAARESCVCALLAPQLRAFIGPWKEGEIC
jgi:hypothetical protein